MWAALQHNMQGEYCAYTDNGNCNIQWLHWSALGLSWFIPTFLIVLILGLGLSKIVSFAFSRKS